MKFANYESNIGRIRIGYTDKAVTLIKIEEGDCNDEDIHSDLSDKAFVEIEEYLNKKRKHFDFPYILQGTQFQKKVWQALKEIPYGEMRTYKEIATMIGNPNASRAVGMANNKNPLLIVIPCHRVIGSNGKLVGYAGGLDMKSNLLELEKA